MTDTSSVIRSFERMFPQIADEERQYERTLLAEGKNAAERELRIKQQQNDITEETAGTLIGVIIDDFENEEETFIPAKDLGKDSE